MARTNAAFMSGVPELLVLKLLMRQEMYGYEIVRSIRLATGEVIVLAEGVIYPTLHSLESRGLLKATEKKVGGRTRVYYTITDKGKKQFGRLREHWEKINTGITSCLNLDYV